ncbi:hypothetical protein [Marimonas lutisalis]|uniref:hypothetical protein n=1 Tax=Marimonas lutisalis TaxID=2545756 RepID=UPI0010F9577B|nr:hypothetical protein [Marimonas lutisalis]
MKKAVTLCAMLAAAPAGAFEIDYPALFEAFADQVREVSEDERVLELPGPVTVIAREMKNGAVNFMGFDQSGLGPAGCGFDTLVNAMAFAEQCGGTLSESEVARLSELAQQAAGFVAENGMFEGGKAAAELMAEAMAGARPMPCPAEGNKSAEYVGQLKDMLKPEGTELFERMLSKPRLPVCLAQTYSAAE